MKQLFEGLKVIELASVLAGPSVGMFFAELGAEVLKVENPNTQGDVTRSWKLASEDLNHPFSAYYSSVNWGKKSVFWNLKDPSDQDKLKKAIAEADVLLLNFKAGDAEKLGLDYKSVKKMQPQIIYGSISGFGDSKRIAYDIVLQAESGFLSMTGEAGGKPVKMPVALIDLLAAHQLKEGILLAMLHRQKQKKAVKVSVSLLDSALAALANQATNWLMGDHIPQPMGSLHPNIAPYGECFVTSDNKQIVLAIGNNNQFKALCSLLGLDRLHEEPNYKSNQKRVDHRHALAGIISSKIAQWERDDLLNQMIAHDIPAGAIRNMKEVFEMPEARQRLMEEEKEGKTLKTVKGNAFKLEFG
jgi:crotonobetainyl-CoA:carnitine CoA-transferase CaiB-like acyl-CoA transferase